MRIFNILSNVAKAIKNAITHSDTNLQTAKNYSDANLQTAKTYSRNYEVMVMRRTIGASENINNITETGLYVIGANPPSGISSTYTWSYVMVFSQGGQGGYFVHQFLFKPTSGVFLMREWSGSPGRWSAWKKSTWSNL